MKKVVLGAILMGLALFSSCKHDLTKSDPSDQSETPTGTQGNIEEEKVPGCPVFSPIGGFYKTKQNVTIECENSTAIYYTILKPTYDGNGKWDETAWKEAVNNSLPTESSNKYTGAFEVGEQCIVRALSVFEDGTKHYAMTAFDFDLDRSTDFNGPWTPVNPASENWQDQTIYFILTDRFFNGDTTNDKISGLTDQNGNPYDESVVLSGQPASGYNGGDIKGITQKLQYIKDLGFTAIWMTPPVKCQIAESNYHGYHGYWASDFTEVDPHMGTLEDYQEFVKKAHELGLYVIQDIVVNHLGDYQQIKKDITKEMVEVGNIGSDAFFLEPNSVPLNHPEQLPWAMNHINNLTADEFQNNAFYHYNTEISDYTNQTNMYTHSSSNLDDMVTENPVVRNLLRGYFRYWIDKCGIDGYRIDTALYVEPDFFEGFINSTESGNMGVRQYGISKGKKDFIDFGEAFSQSESVCGSYTKNRETGTARMDSMLYFPLRYAIADTISSGSKTNAISNILKARYTQGYYNNPNRLVTFIDNHDMDRWGQTMKGNTEMIKAAYNLIYTIPGIPQVYYGSEQGFNGQCREGMFTGSFKDVGTTQDADHFDTTGNWYKYFQQLNKMRSENEVFRYNTLYVLQDTGDGAGIFSYIVRQTNKSTGKVLSTFEPGQKAIFVMNTASTDKILDASYKGLADGDEYELINYEGISVCPEDGTSLTTSFVASTPANSNKGNVKLIVPANSCAVYILKTVGKENSADGCTLNVTEVPSEKITGNEVTIKGKSDVTGTVKVVLNGDYSLATAVSVTAEEEFEETLDIAAYSNGSISVQLVQFVDNIAYYSSSSKFTIERPYKLIGRVSDPAGDDNGVGVAKGKLQIPTDAPFTKTLDIQGVEVYRSGNDIMLGLKMGALSHGWNPTSNYFDHVVFYVFISDGDNNGCEYHSRSNYKLPDSFGKWDYMFQANGWGQAYYSKDGATATTFGKAVTPAPSNNPKTDWDLLNDSSVPGVEKYTTLDWSNYAPAIGSEWTDKPGMVWIKIPAAAMGYPSSLSGYKFYVNTFDFDMGSPRGMQTGDPSRYKFGTGDLAVSDVPTIVDELDNVIVIE